MRPLSACKACRERRKKCIRLHQGMSCNFCVSRGLHCTLPQDVQAASSTTRVYAPLGLAKADEKGPPISPALNADPEFVEEIVDLYFRYYHVSFPCLFHPPSFKRAAKDKSIPRILFFGIASLAARYSSHPSIAHLPPWDRGKPYAEETERLLNLHDTSLTSLQACVLLGIVGQTLGEPNTESNFYALAYRMALILDLPNAFTTSLLEKEIHIRVWWSLLTLDTWNSSALCIPRTIKWRDDVSLPMDEWTFLHCLEHRPLSPGPTEDESLESPASSSASCEQIRKFSILGHKVKLNLLLYEIIRLNMAVVAEEITAYDLGQTVERLTMSLDEWSQGLPEEWQYGERNLVHWDKLGMGRLFMSVHMDYNHACQLLYFQFLYLSQDPGVCNTAAVSYHTACHLAERCNHHAETICQLLYDANKRPGTEMLHTLLAHVLSIASAVQIHTLLFSPDETRISAARERLESNFTFLTRLHTYWPNVASSFSRLEAFHNACLRSKDSSFRMDIWMLHFIIDFSRPMGDKSIEPQVEGEEDIWSLDRLRHVLLEPQ